MQKSPHIKNNNYYQNSIVISNAQNLMHIQLPINNNYIINVQIITQIQKQINFFEKIDKHFKLNSNLLPNYHIDIYIRKSFIEIFKEQEEILQSKLMNKHNNEDYKVQEIQQNRQDLYNKEGYYKIGKIEYIFSKNSFNSIASQPNFLKGYYLIRMIIKNQSQVNKSQQKNRTFISINHSKINKIKQYIKNSQTIELISWQQYNKNGNRINLEEAIKTKENGNIQVQIMDRRR